MSFFKKKKNIFYSSDFYLLFCQELENHRTWFVKESSGVKDGGVRRKDMKEKVG
jgi:hypothetical protein